MTKTNLTPSLSVVLRDMKLDGVVIFTTSSSSDLVAPHRSGFCLTCQKTMGSSAEIFAHQMQFPDHFKNFFSCASCKRKMIGRQEYESHMKLHRSSQHFCKICSKVFAGATALQLHEEMHDRDKHRCSKCTMTFQSEECLQKHLVEHNREEEQQHPVQNLLGIRAENFLQQQKTGNTRGKSFRVSGSTFKVRKALKQHRMMRQDVKKRHCHRCGVTFHRVSDLRSHQQKKHRSNSGFRCRYCSALFRSESGLKSHVRVKHAVNLTCELCGTHFDTEASLEQHLQKDRCGVVKVVKCDLCNEDVPDLEFTKRQHLVKVHGAILKCRVCSGVFESAHSISRHFKLKHQNRTTFTCKRCGDVFLNGTDRENHSKWCFLSNLTAPVPRSSDHTSQGTTDPSVSALTGLDVVTSNSATVEPTTRDLTESDVAGSAPSGLTAANATTAHPGPTPDTKRQPQECRVCHKKFANLKLLQSHLFSMECADLSFKASVNGEVAPNTQKDNTQKDKSDKKEKTVSRQQKKLLQIVKCCYCRMSFCNKLKLAKHIWRAHSHRQGQQEQRPAVRRKSEGPGGMETRPTVPRNGKDSCDASSVSHPVEPNDGDSSVTSKVSDKRDKTYSCLQCGKKYWKSRALEAHIQRRHSTSSNAAQEPKGANRQTGENKQERRPIVLRLNIQAAQNRQQNVLRDTERVQQWEPNSSSSQLPGGSLLSESSPSVAVPNQKPDVASNAQRTTNVRVSPNVSLQGSPVVYTFPAGPFSERSASGPKTPDTFRRLLPKPTNSVPRESTHAENTVSLQGTSIRAGPAPRFVLVPVDSVGRQGASQVFGTPTNWTAPRINLTNANFTTTSSSRVCSSGPGDLTSSTARSFERLSASNATAFAGVVHNGPVGTLVAPAANAIGPLSLSCLASETRRPNSSGQLARTMYTDVMPSPEPNRQSATENQTWTDLDSILEFSELSNHDFSMAESCKGSCPVPESQLQNAPVGPESLASNEGKSAQMCLNAMTSQPAKEDHRTVSCFICDREFNCVDKLLHHLRNNHN